MSLIWAKVNWKIVHCVACFLSINYFSLPFNFEYWPHILDPFIMAKLTRPGVYIQHKVTLKGWWQSYWPLYYIYRSIGAQIQYWILHAHKGLALSLAGILKGNYSLRTHMYRYCICTCVFQSYTSALGGNNFSYHLKKSHIARAKSMTVCVTLLFSK